MLVEEELNEKFAKIEARDQSNYEIDSNIQFLEETPPKKTEVTSEVLKMIKDA